MKIVKLDSVSKTDVHLDGARGVKIQWLISPDDGAENFAMRMFELEPGGHTPFHTHQHEHEVFIVEGRGTLVCEGGEHPFTAEHVIFVPGGAEHRFKNTGSSTLRFLCLIPASAV